LALRLHEQSLAEEYSRITKTSNGKDGGADKNYAIEEPLEAIKKKMLACQKVREKLEYFFDNGVTIDELIIELKSNKNE
jgi:hypothetical protein